MPRISDERNQSFIHLSSVLMDYRHPPPPVFKLYISTSNLKKIRSRFFFFFFTAKIKRGLYHHVYFIIGTDLYCIYIYIIIKCKGASKVIYQHLAKAGKLCVFTSGHILKKNGRQMYVANKVLR